MNYNQESVLIWDHSDPPPNNSLILLWKGYKENKNQRSILKYLDDNSDQLRSEYLDFIHSIGELKVAGKRIVEHLEIEPGFSLWWMSLLAEKSSSKSKTPLNCLRLVAVNHFLKNNHIKSLVLFSGNKSIACSLQQLCRILKIQFSWNYTERNQTISTKKKIITKLPHYMKGILYLLKNSIIRWPLRKALNTKWLNEENSIIIFSYFIHLNLESFKSNNFYSHQWEVLPNLIHRYGKKLNWVHHFMFSSVVPNIKTGIDWLRMVNNKNFKKEHHNFIDSFLTIGTIVKTITIWFSLTLRMSRINKKIMDQIYKYDKGWLWPLILDDWKSSVYGINAIQNILYVQLIENVISSLPSIKKIGLYLCENQGWERALIHSWKKHGHGRIIAVQHSSIRYWDLRYYNDPKTWVSKKYLSQPIPDQIAINGPAAWKACKDAHQPMNKMVKIEAVRYLHLEDIDIQSYDNNKINVQTKKVLILGDLLFATTESMLNSLESISEYFKDGWHLTLKPHPANSININNYSKLNLTLSNEPLVRLLPHFQIAITSVYTSAAIEAYLAGIPVITILNDNDFNSSPLRDAPGISFVSTPLELKNTLIGYSTKLSDNCTKKLFWIDSKLPRWKMLLGLK